MIAAQLAELRKQAAGPSRDVLPPGWTTVVTDGCFQLISPQGWEYAYYPTAATTESDIIARAWTHHDALERTSLERATRLVEQWTQYWVRQGRQQTPQNTPVFCCTCGKAFG